MNTNSNIEIFISEKHYFAIPVVGALLYVGKAAVAAFLIIKNAVFKTAFLCVIKMIDKQSGDCYTIINSLLFKEVRILMNSRKFLLILILIVTVITVGVIGYSKLMGIGLIDALYMTVITISTVGYGEVAPMSEAAKIFSICLIFSGLAIIGYGLTSVFSLFFEGELKDAWRKKRMDAKIARLKEHFIICGAGDVAQTVIERFKENGCSFVVIEKNEDLAEELMREGFLTVHGDATHEATLEKAGIKKARGIVCVLSNDADNVFNRINGAPNERKDIHRVQSR